MKKPDVYLKEYCQHLSDENLKFLAGRLNQRLGGDLAEVFDFLCEVREIDRWLASSETCEGLFEMIDLIHTAVINEYDSRCTTSSAA